MRARVRAARGGPCWSCDRGRAGRSSPPSPGFAIVGGSCPRRCPRASRLPASHAPRQGRGPRAGGAQGSPLPPAGAEIPAGGGWRGDSGALPGGHRVRAQRGCSAARPVRWLRGSATGSVPARGDSRCGDVRGALPPAGPHGAGLRGGQGVRGAPAVVDLPPPRPPRSRHCHRPRRVAPATAVPTPRSSRRQDSLAPVVMVTAEPVNERLSDTRAPAPADVAPGRARVPGCHRSGRCGGTTAAQTGVPGLGLFPSPSSGTRFCKQEEH